MQENDSCGNVIYFELFGENCMEIKTTGIKVFEISGYVYMRLSSLGLKLKKNLNYRVLNEPGFTVHTECGLPCYVPDGTVI
jgi:hypothetical protein